MVNEHKDHTTDDCVQTPRNEKATAAAWPALVPDYRMLGIEGRLEKVELVLAKLGDLHAIFTRLRALEDKADRGDTTLKVDLESVHKKIRATNHRLDLTRADVHTHGNDIRELAKELVLIRENVQSGHSSVQSGLNTIQGRLRSLESTQGSTTVARAERQRISRWLAGGPSPPVGYQGELRTAIENMLGRDRRAAMSGAKEEPPDIGY